ncbi:TlpA disulfide reductase family protein [Tuwongella immobilis]|uniref:Thioredoxin domain-containing protein n=1 Tax=Tuwongella immobilis TaxID=692036 RepID=A0A6C2YLE8_9BACT|nr:TlpA disulfide reductase family protein [Tuwongella immobilis]VIP02398.1 thiol:disulfide interchange protein : Thiol:disulfide interchange protein OS=Singulisphaera acidiphila (strain ATCC BAA-1392 / DSM 18658 / VKM B-2454 / MOB10) GN=Sinac_3156 PE=4 SV=1: Thioredoxin_8 [Tuwongella immobilis]VTS01280.1 thiol:disulfide interchange protein : Thiol:disulfide interchange protein OS=Singulisphaera acidiphila (strain ATCC BAA-1392 / DSM 18658 / VKM B-2454 / MOB10) GN=Sinac_3156 PE=4 SV=1: Thioredoxi
MKLLPSLARAGLFAALLLGTATLAQSADAPVTLKVGKFADVLKYVEANRGKVVVIDFWADYCVPCKKEFPNLVRLHRQRAADGLVCVSVSVDDPEDKDKALAFLTKQGAGFFNILLDEKYEVWQDHYTVAAVPMVVVYGKDGKLARTFSYDDPKNQFEYADVEKFIGTLLPKK